MYEVTYENAPDGSCDRTSTDPLRWLWATALVDAPPAFAQLPPCATKTRSLLGSLVEPRAPIVMGTVAWAPGEAETERLSTASASPAPSSSVPTPSAVARAIVPPRRLHPG